MDTIKAVLFEPVGCLAEFRADELNNASAELFAVTDAAATGSQAYWRLLGLLAPRHAALSKAEWDRLQGFELEVISACVLGGVSLTGGIGSMAFVIAGVLIMGIVQNAMNLLNVPTFYQYVARGLILLAAVLFDRWKRRKQ